VTVLIAKGVGFIDSIFLRTQRDRIIPYIAVMIFYFWVWYVFRNQGFPKEAVLFAFAAFLSVCFGVFFNSFFKVSMHALSMGVVVTLLIVLSLNSGKNFGPYLSIGLLLAGLVCTSRLVMNDHKPFDIYAGLLIGALSTMITWLFVY
jgi:membrane-associated phospholipid phosphatase